MDEYVRISFEDIIFSTIFQLIDMTYITAGPYILFSTNPSLMDEYSHYVSFELNSILWDIMVEYRL